MSKKKSISDSNCSLTIICLLFIGGNFPLAHVCDSLLGVVPPFWWCECQQLFLVVLFSPSCSKSSSTDLCCVSLSVNLCMYMLNVRIYMFRPISPKQQQHKNQN